MKHLLILLMLFSYSQLNAQSGAPLAMEDKKTDAYLMSRKPAKLIVEILNLPDPGKKINITYTLVQLGISMQSTKHAETNAEGRVEILLDQNLPYQQIWLNADKYLYAGIYVNEGLTVTIDANKVPANGAYMIGEGVLYSGIDGELNTVMNKRVLFRKPEREKLNGIIQKLRTEAGKHTPDAVLIKIDSVRNELTKLDEQFCLDYPTYKWAARNETLSELFGELCLYYSAVGMPAKLFQEVSMEVSAILST
ncbi:hypothetical protein [Pedobacter sp. GR22-6]|uniref:hypothetical protein n=1 Tax=Pedobacter sp. GR22-6 TaxID=3127957 RepID=UPI00307E2CED